MIGSQLRAAFLFATIFATELYKMTQLTAEEFRKKYAKPPTSGKELTAYHRLINAAEVKASKETLTAYPTKPIEKKVTFTPSRSTKEALVDMGHYFELDQKEVKFYIRQLELSGKL